MDLVNNKLTSPNFPKAYDPLTECKWNVTAPQGYYVTLDFDIIDVSKQKKDFLPSYSRINMYQYTIPKYFCLYQFNSHFTGDYISIQEIDSNGNHKLVAHLTGPDEGPKSESAVSNWNIKIISSSTNRMTVEFKSDDSFESKGFFANIYFTPFSNEECESWLDMNKKIFKSPNYPLTHNCNIKCSWLITVDHDQRITLDVTEYYVRYQIFISSVFF